MSARATQCIPVVWRERPFSGALHSRVLPLASRIPTIAEIVAAEHNLPKEFEQIGEVRINGELVPRALWHLVRPRWNPSRDTVVSLHIPLGHPGGSGGGSGGGQASKNPLGTVLMVAVLLAAAAVSGGALGIGAAVGGFLGISASVGAAVAGAAIGLGGALAIAALVPPPTLSPTAQAIGGAAGVSNTNTTNPAAASLTGNLLAPGAPMPRVQGIMRIFPPLLCNPLVEVVGDQEFVEAVFGLPGPHSLNEVEIGETAISSISQVTSQLVEGKPGDAIQTLVTRQSFTNNVNAELIGFTLDPTTQYQLLDQGNPAADIPQSQPFVSRKAPDELWINMQWPEGLFNASSTAAVVNQPVRVQIRRKGASTWINLPELHFSMNAPGAFQKVVRLKWGSIPNPPNTPPANAGPVMAFKHVPGQNGSTITPATSGWDADPYFSSGAGNDVLSASTLNTAHVVNTELYADKAIFYLNPATFPQDTYEVQIIRGLPYASASFTPSIYNYSGAAGSAVYDLFGYYLASGVARTTLDSSQYHARIVLSRVSSVWNQNPIQSTDFATISVRAYGLALQQLSVLAAAYIKDWDGSGWNTFTTSQNPAPHLYDVLTGALGSSPVSPSLVNSDELVTWRQHCIDNGLTINAVVEGKTYSDVINVICSAGMARIRHNELWGVFIDKDRSAEAPVQVFTPVNMAGFSATKQFALEASGIRAIFTNADDNYAQPPEQTIVYFDKSSQDANNLQQIQYDGLTHEVDVVKRANFDLNQARDRLTFYSGDAPIESIVCMRGDLVAVQHDILTRKAGYARVAAVLRSGGNITGLQLSGTVPVNTTAGIFSTAHLFQADHVFDLGASTGASIRLKGGNGQTTQALSGSGELDIITFATPFADPGSNLLDEDCVVSIGPLGSEYKRLICTAIAPKTDQVATLTFVDEAPQLWN